MSGDEVFVTMIGAILGLCGLGRWFYFLARFGVGGYGASLSLLPFILLALCFFVLRTWASHDVRDSGTYLSMYLILGAGWLVVSMMLLPLFGLSFRDDAIERKNPAASLAIAGFLAGMTACYSGGNIGDGPGWWVVLFAAGIASAALISQNKRLPLFWDALGVRCPTWRELLPETRDVRGAHADGNWAIKPAFGRVGELVGWEGAVSNSDWRKIQRWSRWFPGSWIAQRRFDSRPLATSAGPRHVCLGVYTIAGKAEGIYGRASQSPIIDYRAQDVPVLLHSSHERN